MGSVYEIYDITEPSSGQGPLAVNDIRQLTQRFFETEKPMEELSSHMLAEFSKKSSKHKFIVQVTRVAGNSDTDMSITADFGAVWESEKDGYVTVTIGKMPEPVQKEVEKVGEADKHDNVDDKNENDEADKVDTSDDIEHKVQLTEESNPNNVKRKDTIGGLLDDYIEVEPTTCSSEEKYLVSIFWLYVG